MMISKLLIGID